jgi:hypothetical protein
LICLRHGQPEKWPEMKNGARAEAAAPFQSGAGAPEKISN